MELITHTDIKNSTRSPTQCPFYKTTEGKSVIDEHNVCVACFGDILEENETDISPFLTCVGQKVVDVYCLSQQYYEILIVNGE